VESGSCEDTTKVLCYLYEEPILVADGLTTIPGDLVRPARKKVIVVTYLRYEE
jgi:hypothetical protein